MIVYSKVIVQPANEPVTLPEVKEHLRLDADSTIENSYLTVLIKVARQLCESYSGLSFLTQQREINLDRFPCTSYIQIPNGPVQSIDDFVYIDGDGNSIPLVVNDDYIVDLNSDIPRVQFVSSWPVSKVQMNSVTIAYTAGYLNDEHNPLPEVIKQAMLMQIASMYENRQDEITGSSSNLINWTSQALLDTIKIYYNANA